MLQSCIIIIISTHFCCKWRLVSKRKKKKIFATNTSTCVFISVINYLLSTLLLDIVIKVMVSFS